MAAEKSRPAFVERFRKPQPGLAEFYREEFRKHHDCLEQYREYYSEQAITQAEEALGSVIRQMEELCQRENACELVGQLLRQFDAVTKLSVFSEPKQFH